MLLGLRSLWEDTTPPTPGPTLPNPPGRVFKSQYPYFKPRKKPYWEDDNLDEEEVMLGIEL